MKYYAGDVAGWDGFEHAIEEHAEKTLCGKKAIRKWARWPETFFETHTMGWFEENPEESRLAYFTVECLTCEKIMRKAGA